MAEADAVPSDAAQVLHARAAISVAFFTMGAGFAIWVVHIPVITLRLGIDPATLGLALLNVGLGAVISQPIAGWIIGRIGSRPVSIVTLLVFLAVFIAPTLAWSTPVFFAATLLLGLTAGACNVAVNTQASEIERARGKPTMSSFHGFFSLGGLAGAFAGGVIIANGQQYGTGAAVAAVVALVVAAIASPYFLTTSAAPKPATEPGRKRLTLPTGALLGLSVLIFFANTVEGSVGDWSALYLHTVRNLSEATAASGFAIFSLAMAVCRLAGGPVVARLGEQRIVLYGGILIALGMAVVVFSPWASISPFGFGLVAIGAANTYPVIISAASRIPGVTPSAGVAIAATGALLGFLIGPPAIGFIAQAAGLGTALALLGLVGLMVVVGAVIYRWPESQTRD